MNRARADLLQADTVCVRLGERLIVDNCNLAVDAGEFIGIIGPNGAGKTTLLKSLRGLLPLSAGQVRALGTDVHKLPAKQAARLIAYMQQDVNVGFGFTAREVVLAGRYPYLKWWQHETATDRKIVQKYMDFTGVIHLSDQPVNTVSGGERQRILLAKVLAQETKLIFLDEPTASLDLVYQEEIFRYCQALCRQGKTVLLIAHDIRLAARFCSRLILLAAGKLIADGTPSEVITAANLAGAYGLQSTVYHNYLTGHIDIHTYERQLMVPKERIHVVGGGGAAATIMRCLIEQGYTVTAGILTTGDTDAVVASAFGIDYVELLPFSAINEQHAFKHREQLAKADIVVLTNIYYSLQNLDNLRAVFSAAKLIVLEDIAIAERDFTDGLATTLYTKLCRRSQIRVMTTAQFEQRVGERRILSATDSLFDKY